MSAAFSAIIIVGTLVFPEVILGIIDAVYGFTNYRFNFNYSVSTACVVVTKLYLRTLMYLKFYNKFFFFKFMNN